MFDRTGWLLEPTREALNVCAMGPVAMALPCGHKVLAVSAGRGNPKQSISTAETKRRSETNLSTGDVNRDVAAAG
jgi:hypothetical protein